MNINAQITDEARKRWTDQLRTGKSFAITDFSVGDTGYDPLNPTVALVPDVTLLSCPTSSYSAVITSSSDANPLCPVFTCVVPELEGLGAMGHICLVATLVYPPGDPDVDAGLTFPFAIGNFPLRVKTDAEELTFAVSVSV